MNAINRYSHIQLNSYSTSFPVFLAIFLFLMFVQTSSVVSQSPSPDTPAQSKGKGKDLNLHSKQDVFKHGVEDSFPTFRPTLVPGIKEKVRTSMPHEKSGLSFFGSGDDKSKSEPQKDKDQKSDDTSLKQSNGNYPSLWSRAMQRLRKDRTLTNVILLTLLVAVFLAYRLRIGRRGGRN